MRKSEYAKQQQKQRRRSRRTQRETNRARRYRHVSTSARDGHESSHSLREISSRHRRRRRVHDPRSVEAATNRYHAASSPASKYGTAKIRKSAKNWYAVVIGRKPGIYYGWPLAWEQVDKFFEGRAYKCADLSEARDFHAVAGETNTPRIV